MTDTYYIEVITDSYAGNFERELCAFLTLSIGECEVGDEIAELVSESLPADVVSLLQENTGSEPDDHGCWRPVKLAPHDINGIWINIGDDDELNREYINTVLSRIINLTELLEPYKEEYSEDFHWKKLFTLNVLSHRVIHQYTITEEVQL